MTMNILVLHGPNLNLLGEREPGVYGAETLDNINQTLKAQAKDHQVDCYQSNAEHELVDAVHQAKTKGVDGILINPAAFTHTSVALRDALLAVAIPFIEVHLSNMYAREPFRHKSYFSDIAIGVISGFGQDSYTMGMSQLIKKIESV